MIDSTEPNSIGESLQEFMKRTGGSRTQWLAHGNKIAQEWSTPSYAKRPHQEQGFGPHTTIAGGCMFTETCDLSEKAKSDVLAGIESGRTKPLVDRGSFARYAETL